MIYVLTESGPYEVVGEGSSMKVAISRTVERLLRGEWPVSVGGVMNLHVRRIAESEYLEWIKRNKERQEQAASGGKDSLNHVDV